MARIIIIDDHPIVREGMAQLIEQRIGHEHSVIGQADSADEALRMVDRLLPEMVIVDLFLNGPDGIGLIKRLKAKHPGIRILVLSMHDESQYAGRAMAAGAQGYVMKQRTLDEILAAINKVLEGHVYVSDKIIDSLLYGIMKQKEPSPSSVSQLTDRELEVLGLFGMGWTTRKIAKHLHLSIKTVETYSARIKEKMQLANANELIRHAVQWVNSREFS